MRAEVHSYPPMPPHTLNVLIGSELTDKEWAEEITTEGLLGEENTEESDELLPHLSVLASHGFDGPHTIKLRGSMQGKEVVLMVDSGATHCFVSEGVIREFRWPVNKELKLDVVLGDGSRIKTLGVCSNLPITLNGVVYQVMCYIFPLKEIDIILGVSRLATLGDIKANWASRTLTLTEGHSSKSYRVIRPWCARHWKTRGCN